MRALVLLLLVGCECGPQPECVGVEDCAGRACVEGRCAERADSGPVTYVTRDAGPIDAGGRIDAGGSDAGASDAGCRTGSIVGTVTDPSGALGLPNVRVFIPTTALSALPVGVTGQCSGCEADVSGNPRLSTISTPTGAFRLDGVSAGQVNVVLQLGRWRRSVSTRVNACQTTMLAADLSHLPRSRAEGDLPSMALSTGAADPLECLLLKLGIDPAEFVPGGVAGAVQLYVGNGDSFDGGIPLERELYEPGSLARYDHVFAPCQGGPALVPQSQVAAVQGYVNAGGRFFTTHYGYGWMEQGFPSAANWTPTGQFASRDTVDVLSGFPKGAIYREWLTRVAGLTSPIEVLDPRYNVGAVNRGAIAWLGSAGKRTTVADSYWTAQLTFTTPLGATRGCGRVAFSDFHVSAGAVVNAGPFPGKCSGGALTAQEKVLAFILFDLATCARDDLEAPEACRGLETSCSASLPCCGALRCVDSAGQPCAGSTCQCAP